MSKPATRAEVWCWLAHMHRAESDAVYYSSHIRTPEQLSEADRLQDCASACTRRAKELGATARTEKSAMRKWDTAPKGTQS